jgi:hypothetical protein
VHAAPSIDSSPSMASRLYRAPLAITIARVAVDRFE